MNRERSSAVALVALLLAATATASEAGAPAPSSAPGSVRPAAIEAVARHGKGELRVIEGVPFLKLAGSHREMGIDYGALMKDRIRENLARYPGKLLMQRASALDRFRARRRLPRRDLALIDGIASGSALPAEEVFWFNVLMTSGGCSSVVTRSEEGVLHGHNQDRPAESGRLKAVVEFAPDGAFRYVLSTFVGTVDALSGMNEKGIAVSVDLVEPRPDPPGSERFMPTSSKVRQILETAASLADVEEALRDYALDGSIFIVSSAADQDAAVYDLAPGGVRKTALGSAPHLFATNTYRSEELHAHPEECQRYARYAERLRERPARTVAEVASILADTGALHGINNAYTVHSTVLVPARRQVFFALASSYAAWDRWLAYDWAQDRVTVLAEASVDPSRHEVLLKRMPEHEVAFRRAKLPSAEAQAPLRAELDRSIGKPSMPLPPGCTTYLGQEGGGVDLEVVQPIPPSQPRSPSLQVKRIGAFTAATTIHRGPYQTLPEAHQALERWIAAHGYAVAGPRTECYLKGAWLERDPAGWITEIRVPVTPVKAPTP